MAFEKRASWLAFERRRARKEEHHGEDRRCR